MVPGSLVTSTVRASEWSRSTGPTASAVVGTGSRIPKMPSRPPGPPKGAMPPVRPRPGTETSRPCGSCGWPGPRPGPPARPAWPRRFRPWSWPHRWHRPLGRPGRPRWHLGDPTSRADDGAGGWAGRPRPLDALTVEVTSEPGTIGAGALDAEQLDGAEVLQPVQEIGVALRCRLEGLDAEESSPFVQSGCNMHVEVRVDPAGDLPCHSGHCHPFVPIGWGGTTSIRTTDKTATGLCGRLL